tara:strand:+ start:308 stop:547 length:240 start_codon:yes stop_codon:yes gene_type:complete
MERLIDADTIVVDRESNKTILKELKISFKPVRNEQTMTKYLKLFLNEAQDKDLILQELNRWQVQTFISSLIPLTIGGTK